MGSAQQAAQARKAAVPAQPRLRFVTRGSGLGLASFVMAIGWSFPAVALADLATRPLGTGRDPYPARFFGSRSAACGLPYRADA